MSKIENTDLNLLLSELRGEIGGIIETWIFYRDHKIIVSHLSTNNFEIDLKNRELNKFIRMKKRYEDEIISRLSELAHKSYGKVNFYFTIRALKKFDSEFKDYEDFITSHKIKARRDEYISHKKMPQKNEIQRGEYHINYQTIIKAIVRAIMLMKMIDNEVYGDITKLQWKQVRKLRYDFELPLEANYKILNYIRKI